MKHAVALSLLIFGFAVPGRPADTAPLTAREVLQRFIGERSQKFRLELMPAENGLPAFEVGATNGAVTVRGSDGVVEALMERCSEYALAYASALNRTGADMLSGGDSPAGLLGPDLYQALALPAERQLIARMKAATAKPVSLHICGNATRILPLMKTSGADVLELDHAVSIREACRMVGPDTALWGNLDPVGVLAKGTPKMVREQSLRVIQAAADAGHARLVLSSGCTLAMDTPAQNIEAMISTASDEQNRRGLDG